MLWILGALALSTFFMLVFIYKDAKAAYDNDPTTHTLSEYIKRWARQSPAHKALLSFAIFQLLVIPLYLFLHWILQII